MNREMVYNWLIQYKTKCICGARDVKVWDFEYASTLMEWLEGEPIGHYGLLGCCEEEE